MSEVLIFPDTKAAVWDLIDGTEHVAYFDAENQPVMVRVVAAYRQSANEHGSPVASTGEVEVVITQDPGTQGFIDRVDRISLDVYAPGEQPMNVLNSLLGLLVGEDIETPSGYLDSVTVDQTPHEIPYPSDILWHAMCRLLVTVRPI